MKIFLEKKYLHFLYEIRFSFTLYLFLFITYVQKGFSNNTNCIDEFTIENLKGHDEIIGKKIFKIVEEYLNHSFGVFKVNNRLIGRSNFPKPFIKYLDEISYFIRFLF